MSVRAVADNLGTDEDDELGPRLLVVLIRKAVADTRNLIEQGNTASGIVLLCAHQSVQQDRLSVGHGNRTLDLSLGDRRRQTGCSCRRNVAYFLFDIEPDISIGVDAWRNTQNDTRVAIVDRVDDRAACRQYGGAAGGNWHDVADLEGGCL